MTKQIKLPQRGDLSHGAFLATGHAQLMLEPQGRAQAIGYRVVKTGDQLRREVTPVLDQELLHGHLSSWVKRALQKVLDGHGWIRGSFHQGHLIPGQVKTKPLLIVNVGTSGGIKIPGTSGSGL